LAKGANNYMMCIWKSKYHLPSH